MKLNHLISNTVYLKFDSLSKTFSREGKALPVFDRVSIEVRPKELVALVGPSGCGKTTLLHIISGLVGRDSGEIFFNGVSVNHLQNQVAYMQQKDCLLLWRSALGHTLLNSEIAGENWAQARNAARHLFEEFDLAGSENVYPGELSGGMRQRVSLIRTLLCKKSVFLLDEPFGALDALTRRPLQEWFLQAWARFNFSALFVTHDVEEALILADRVYVLSARPARVKTEIRIDLPHPRLPTDSKFVPLKAELLAWLNQAHSIHADQGGTAHVS